MDGENAVKQQENSKGHHLKPYQFKKGQSGNPKGRPVGKSLKEYTREMLSAMTEEERQDFLQGVDKQKLWEMAEGKADTKTDLTSGGDKIEGVVILPEREDKDGKNESS